MSEVSLNDYGWLYDNMDGLKEKIVFKDRIEYRISGELHNHTGPAIIYTYNGDPDEADDVEYYLKGIKMTEEQWSVNTRKHKVKKLIKKAKENEQDFESKES